MRNVRIIPVLLLSGNSLVKTKKFTNPAYIGDPINAVRIFNEKEVDELCLLDIDATKEGRRPNFEKIIEIVSEAFMPVSYGGGISTVEDAAQLFYNGVEKVVINHNAIAKPELITDIAERYGSQSVVASIDYKKGLLGTNVYTKNGKQKHRLNPLDLALELEKRGAGELMITNIDRDGTYTGYDLEMIRKIHEKVKIPIICSGGAGELQDFKNAFQAGASAMAAGSFFVFRRPHNAVLITYPNRDDINKILK